MDILVRSHVDTSGSGGLTVGDHFVPRSTLLDYETFFYLGQMTFPLPTKQLDALNQQLNEQVFELYRSDEAIYSLIAPGVVSSVDLDMPDDEFNVTGSPITSYGTISVTKKNQSAHTVFAGPTSGIPVPPAFRSLVVADIPSLSSIYQPRDDQLDYFSALSSNADTLPYFDIDDHMATTAFTAFGRSLIDDIDAATARATLGLGTMSTQNANAVNITGGILKPDVDSFYLRDQANTRTAMVTLGDTLTANRVFTVILNDADRIFTLAGNATISGTHSGTSSGTNTGDVTLAGTPNYITISSQVITRSLIDLASHVTGRLPLANFYQSSGPGLLGRSAVSSGDLGMLLAVDPYSVMVMNSGGTAIGFGQVQLDQANAVNGRLPVANFIQGSGLSVLGVTGASTANFGSIAGTANQVLRVNGLGTALGFGQLDLSSSSAVVNRLPYANFVQAGSGVSILAKAGSGSGNWAEMVSAVADSVLVTNSAGTSLTWGAVNLASSDAVTGKLSVANGGTGLNTATAYGVVAAGTTSTGPFQVLSSLGSSNQVLTSNGAGALPSWSNPLTIGRAVASGTASRVLYEDGSSNLAVSGNLTFDGTTLSTAAMVVSPSSGDVSMYGKIPGTGNYVQFAFRNPANAQRGFFGYIGSTFGGGRSDHFEIGSTTSTNIYFRPGDTGDLMIFDYNGNIKIGGSAARGTTESTNSLVIFNGTAPVGTLTNGASFYAASGEMRVMDSAGNSTLLSPHDKDGNWIHDEINFKGRRLRIDMERMLKDLDRLLGGGYIQEAFNALPI